jgi:spermidine synthase
MCPIATKLFCTSKQTKTILTKPLFMHTLGKQIIAEYYECPAEFLSDVSFVENMLLQAAEEMQATVITSAFHHFSPMGVSGVVVIQESHIAIHTWPEYGYAAIDIFTCGTELQPLKGYNYMMKALQAGSGSMMELLRGHKSLMPYTAEPPAFEEKAPEPVFHRNVWFTERNDTMAFSLRYKGDILYNKRSAFQKVQVYDTFEYGKMLVLDEKVMTTEKDEFAYHEMVTHVPLLAHAHPQRVLIIGGGDGGTAREVLKHRSVEEVVVVEIDGDVVKVCQGFLPEMADSLMDDRVTLKIEDGITYMQQLADASFDVIIVDSTDPEGPATGLFGHSFYTDVYRVLKAGGIVVVQGESPLFNQATFRDIRSCHADIFGSENVHTYLVHIPTYPSGMWSFGFASKGVHPVADVDDSHIKAFTACHSLKYYNSAVHKAAFELPNFVKEMVAQESMSFS